MYRLLTIKRANHSAQKVRRLSLTHGRVTESKCVVGISALKWQLGGGGGTRAVYSQLFRLPVLDTEAAVSKNQKLLAPMAHQLEQQSRTQSGTSTSAAESVKSKKTISKKPKYAKFVELLEVTDLTANERKSKVKRLRAKKLEEFIAKTQVQILEKQQQEQSPQIVEAAIKTQPIEYQPLKMDDTISSSVLEADVFDDKPLIFLGKEQRTQQFIDNADRVQSILRSYHNFREIIDTMTHEEQDFEPAIDEFGSSLSSATALDAHETIADSLADIDPFVTDVTENFSEFASNSKKKFNMPTVATATTPAKGQLRFKSKTHNNEEQERLAKERALRINLSTYMTVCVSAGLVNRGLSTLIAYRSRAQKSNSRHAIKPINIDLYNILLHGFAEKGSFDRFRHIFDLIAEDGLQFNEQTFAAIFECLGRLDETESNKDLIEKYIQKAEDMGLTLNQIIDRSKFLSDQRDIALDAIRRIQPDFVVDYTPPNLYYKNPLLNKLNEHVLPCTNSEQQMKVDSRGIEIMNAKRGFSKEQLETLAREQLQLELNGCITIKSIEKGKEFANAQLCREKLQELEVQWRAQINAAITRDLNTLKAQIRFKPMGYMNYYTYLKTLDSNHFVDVLLQEIYKLAEGSESFSPTVGQLFKELGQKVQQRYLIEQKKQNGVLEKVGDIYSSFCEELDKAQSSDNTRQIWQRLVHKHRQTGPSMDISEIIWPGNVQMGVGRFLYNILMRDVKIDAHIMRQKSKSKTQNILPAFYTLFRNQGRIVKEEVKPHPVLARLLRASRQQTLTFDSNLVPMLCPPQPWSTPHNGGYLLNTSNLIRLPHQAVQQWERINNACPESMYPSLDSLNQLASIPWRVNTDILDVIIHVFQNGGDDKLDVPRPPSSLPELPSLPVKDADSSNAERAKLFKEKLNHRRKQAEMYSLWCDTLYRLSLANHYRNKVFWLPHNMDFRGRVYPLPPHLNHLGSDLARSMLIFDQAQPLGVDGFSWLKLHCINLTGLKKRDSVQERLLYANAIMDDILDSADKPLTGRMWWAKSDEPWQTLSCCIEIAKVHRCANPEEYLSRFPIHQDGSCNGLQHYAALGRDQAGAYSVNLAPSNVPQDVYSAVATLVEKTRKNDADNGLQVAQVLDGFVKRKVIKQTVMTTVYGVTRYGARLQIARQLKDIDDFPKEYVWPASTYLTTKTFESLREMFTSTKEIQDWFTECARLISGVCGQNVEWCTPLGLPVVQPYNRQQFKHTPRAGTRISESMAQDMYERPNVMKQKNAFPPNFIHSLDSSHMMLTSLHCERAGLTFVSVHDCFWTHACTVPELNRICREQFVSLHSQPILEDLARFQNDLYSFKDSDFANDGSVEDHSRRHLNRLLRQLPKKGDFDLRNVLDSVYFFS